MASNPYQKSSGGKRRGKKQTETYVGPRTIERAVEEGTPFVALDPDSFEIQPVWIVNWSDVKNDDNVVMLYWFGAVGSTYVAVLNPRGWESGLDEAASWIESNYPGLLTSAENMRALYEEVLEEMGNAGEDVDDSEVQEQAHERATVDMMPVGDYGAYIPSWEVGGADASDELSERVVNKAKNTYRREFGESPPGRSGRRSRHERKSELQRKYGERIAARHANPDASTRAAALAARLARGES